MRCPTPSAAFSPLKQRATSTKPLRGLKGLSFRKGFVVILLPVPVTMEKRLGAKAITCRFFFLLLPSALLAPHVPTVVGGVVG